MKTTLYMAVSADGYISGDKDNVNWVSEESWQSYQDFVKKNDVVLVGARTFKLMKKHEFVEGPRYFVATSQAISGDQATPIIVNDKADVPKADNLGVIGGGELNGRLAEMGLFDEIVLDIEPVVLGSGTELFGGRSPKLKLKLKSSKKLNEDTIQNRYEVV